MITALYTIFFLSVFLLFFTYGGYALFLLPFIKNRAIPEVTDLPAVTMLVAAYNEEDYIQEKIENCLALDYPSHLIQYVFVTDGSTDRTPEIIAANPVVRLLHAPERKGKTAALNRAMQTVTTPVTISSDANTYLNATAVKNIVRHYQFDNVGGVSGEKKIIGKTKDSAAGSGEGIYWKYESFLKKIDSAWHSLAGAPGELISFRTRLFKPIETDAILDDFMLSMHICIDGYKMVYEPRAYAMETASANIKEELKRKIRICAGGFQAISKLKHRINFREQPKLFYLYFSHRVMRWAVAPWCIILSFVSNAFLIYAHPFFFFTGVIQGFFYLQVGLGWLFKDKNIQVKGFFVPYYFFIMNYAALAGLYKYMKGKQSAAWERSKRATN